MIGELSQTRPLSLSFANVTPAAAVTGEMTLGAFTSSVSGNFSAAPEPASLVLLGIGVTALFAVRCVCKRAAVTSRTAILGADRAEGRTINPSIWSDAASDGSRSPRSEKLPWNA